jgi:hypothetical protein
MENLESAQDLICLGSTCKALRRAVLDLRATVRMADSLRLQEEVAQPLGSQLYTSKTAFMSRKALPSNVPPASVELHLSQILISLPGVASPLATFFITSLTPSFPWACVCILTSSHQCSHLRSVVQELPIWTFRTRSALTATLHWPLS